MIGPRRPLSERSSPEFYIDPKVHFGKPCVAGTRIPVEEVLGLIQEGVPFEEIAHKYYPDLEIKDVKACAWHAAEMVWSEEIHVRAP
ncbi:DUF433 domain-containing protein [Nitrospira sp. Kam-Ns4a]